MYAYNIHTGSTVPLFASLNPVSTRYILNNGIAQKPFDGAPCGARIALKRGLLSLTMALLGEVFVWGGNADDLEVMRDVRGCKYVEFLLLAIHKPFALPTVLIKR